MLEQIKKQLSKHINLETKTGIFFSAFDSKGQVLASNGVITTDRTIESILQSIYTGILAKIEWQTKSLIIDIVKDLRLQNDPNLLMQLSMQERGLFLVQGDGQNSGVLLPNTKGITTIQEGLTAIKKKYNLSNQVSVYIFQTQKITLTRA